MGAVSGPGTVHSSYPGAWRNSSTIPMSNKVPALKSLSSGGKRDEHRDTLKQHTHTTAAFGTQ